MVASCASPSVCCRCVADVWLPVCCYVWLPMCGCGCVHTYAQPCDVPSFVYEHVKVIEVLTGCITSVPLRDPVVPLSTIESYLHSKPGLCKDRHKAILSTSRNVLSKELPGLEPISSGTTMYVPVAA